MKRRTNKLKLHVETIRRISDSDLLGAAGGATRFTCEGESCPLYHSCPWYETCLGGTG